MNKITAGELRRMVRYDAETGLFYRLADSKKGKVKAGDIAGARPNRPDGYIEFCVCGKKYSAHRLAWLHMTGEWPAGQVDHIDGNRGNNAFANLRDVTNGENQQNMMRPKSHNSTGLLGVSRNKRRWKAEIRANGLRVHIGTYDSPEIAHAAYLEAKSQMHIEVGR